MNAGKASTARILNAIYTILRVDYIHTMRDYIRRAASITYTLCVIATVAQKGADMEKARKILNKSFPYTVLLLISIISTYLVFYKGFGWGSDLEFHFSSMLDKYNTILEKGSYSAISKDLGAGLGVGNTLFYSPLSHIIPVTVAIILRFLGVSLMSAFKITLVSNVFLSGVFMYRFALKFTNQNKIASLLAGAVYILYPYRMLNAFLRLALAEAFSFVFIPLFFMGLYGITHTDKDKISLLPFCETVLGGSLLYLSHNITALFVFITGLAYLLANITKIIPLFKSKRFILCGTVSVITLISISSIMLFAQFELMSTGLYNITDEVRMWTDAEKVASRGGEEFTFSGFLSTKYLVNNGYSKVKAYLEMPLYFAACALYTLCVYLLNKCERLKKFSPYISLAALFGIPTIILPRIEIYLALAVFFVIYLFIHYTKNAEKPTKPIYKSILFWFSIGVIAVAFCAMELGEIWLYAPKLLRNIQFPWRLWSLVQISVSILVGIIANHIGIKKISYIVLSTLIGILIIKSQALPEKRIAQETGKRWTTEISEEMYLKHSSIGFNSEYCPQVLFDKSYKSEYKNSLYKYVKYIIPYDFDYEADYYAYSPVILDGKGQITVISKSSPNYELSIQIEEKSIIQMPLIYYPGYKITLTNESGIKQAINGENIDGLISFTVNEGAYTVTTDYVGTPLRKASIALTALGSATVICALFYEALKKRQR
ncbi:MAG: hypothetical protein II984_02905 [Clostridia bacterium]|nr:hypothetical protein [Clostridia bacterium]